jgi:predicted small lipoprotein YifL
MVSGDLAERAFVDLFLARIGRLALAGAILVAALGLASCGRKGPLDPPPSAALTEPAAPRPSLGEESDSRIAPAPSGEARPQRNAAATTPPPPQQKSFFLDFLIGK